jgi:hypothetical protein
MGPVGDPVAAQAGLEPSDICLQVVEVGHGERGIERVKAHG